MVASFSLFTVPTATAVTTNKTKTNSHRFKTHAKQTHRNKVSCNATPDDNNDKTLETSLDMQNVDRRNMILAIGGIFVAANLTSLPSAFADAVAAPSNLSDCAAGTSGIQNLGDVVRFRVCFPPVLPQNPGKDNVLPKDCKRASSEYFKKYKPAIQAMTNSEEGVDTNKLRYKYERSEIPWGKSRPTAYAKGSKIADKSVGVVKKVEDVEFPVKLDETVKVLVKRPAVNRTREDKEKANEILLVNGVRFDGEKFVKFDVFVNDIDNGTETTPADSEFAGSFAQLPHNRTDKMMMTSGVRFGLTELLEDIEAEDDEFVLVTLVPRSGCDDVTVSEIKIELVPIV